MPGSVVRNRQARLAAALGLEPGRLQVMGDLDATREWAARHGGDAAKVGVTGFCWGGKVVWQAAARFAAIGAGVAWYGRLAPAADATPVQISSGQPWPVDIADDLKAPVLGLYGGKDQGIPLASVERMREALARANAAHKLAQGKFLYEVVLSDDSVKFPTDASALSPEAEQRLGELAQRLKAENRNVYLEIQGHTDATGDAKANEALGLARAEAARRFMSREGIALNRIATISYGDTAPVAPNNTREGRAQNRRVAIVVLS